MVHPFALPAGTDIGGFELVRVLGAGGFGITYEAMSPTTRRRWAIKEFFPQGFASREDATKVFYSQNDGDVIQRALTQFERSTQKLSELDHPNILKVFHYIRDNATGYMVMDYVEGPTFEMWLRSRPHPPSLAELRPIVEKVLDALEYAHSCNTVHRDVAPDNIVLRRSDQPVLIDFGALKVIDPNSSARVSSLIVRKRYYSAPEQSEVGLDVRPTLDIYSLAAVLYRAFTGAPPADSEERKSAVAFRRQDPYQPLEPRDDLPVPRATRRAIDRALSFHAEDRPQTVRAFKDSLEWSETAGRALEQQPGGLPRTTATGGPPQTPAPRPRGGGGRALAVGLVVTVMALAGAVLYLLGSRGTNETDLRENALARDADFDAAKLQAYLATCSRCAAQADVLARLALMKSEEATYQAAKGSIDRLEAYAKQCKACVYRDEAIRNVGLLRQGEAARVKADDSAYQSARGSIERLEQYMKSCDLCRHREAAMQEMSVLRNEAARAKADEDAYLAARGSIERLEFYAKTCDVCRYRTEALNEAAKLRDAESNRPAPLSISRERSLQARDVFKECDTCPEMVVVPAGSFTMGSPAKERGRGTDESPQHRVTLSRPLAVGRFEVTFAEWDACAADGGCNGYRPLDKNWGRGRQPAINISWDDAKAYVSWLSRKTGKSYRLLSEAEWEYSARAGSQTAYSWGATLGKNNAVCRGCGTQWDNRQTAPVGSFPPNAFGLYDMHGNVWEWVEDCSNATYRGAPADGSAWLSGNCNDRTIRGGSWSGEARALRSAHRGTNSPSFRAEYNGLRVARTLDTN